MSKLESDVNWIKNIFPEAVNFIKKEIISEFVKDLDYIYEGSDHLYGTPDDNIKEIKNKWEEKLK